MLEVVTRWRMMNIVWRSLAANFETQVRKLGAKPPVPPRTIRFPQDCFLPPGPGETF